jgi:hypothetical protein
MISARSKDVFDASFKEVTAMQTESWPECTFHIPLRRDAEISDGQPHPQALWRWLSEQLLVRFGGMTLAPGIYRGAWKSKLTGQPIHDQTRRYIVALPAERMDDLRDLMKEACAQFEQQCIYLSVAGYVEFIEG